MSGTIIPLRPPAKKVLERARRLLPRADDLLLECDTVREALEDESGPSPDIPTATETIIYRVITRVLGRYLALALGVGDDAMREVDVIEAEIWLGRRLEGLTDGEAGERRA